MAIAVCCPSCGTSFAPPILAELETLKREIESLRDRLYAIERGEPALDEDDES